MNEITKITVTEDVTLITLINSPSDMKFITHLFGLIASKGINVDMISQTAPFREKVSLSFTVADDDMGPLLTLFAVLRPEYPDIKYDVTSGNSKISLYGEAMRFVPGVAANVFDTIAQMGIDIRIITTSEIDISLLVSQSDVPTALDSFRSRFGVKPQTVPAAKP